MDNKPAGKVEGTEFGEEATAPYPMSHGVVDEDCPQEDKYRKGGKFHAFGKSPRDERRRQRGKHALESDKRQFGDGAALQNFQANACQTDFVEIADKAVYIRAEGHRVADKDKFNRDKREYKETLHNRCEYILAPHHAAIEEGKTRCHDKDQSGADEYPCGIASINHHNQSFP